jgi:hypothetical protein
MTKEFRMGYIQSVKERYLQALKTEKGRILDELCRVCHLNRKYAIAKIHNDGFERDKVRRRRTGRKKLYPRKLLAVVESVWLTAGYPWSVRLKAIFEGWLPWIELRYRLSKKEQDLLLRISPSTLDRFLKGKKIALKRRLYGRTKPGTLLRRHIPIRTDFFDVRQAGWTEMDLVSHSGRCAEGEFAHTLNLTDIASTWTESRCVLGKSEYKITPKLEDMRQGFPFPLRGLDADNGSEFINNHVAKYCQDHALAFTRSRPYKKDDNAHIEQKNWTHVRKLIGWDRYDSEAAVRALDDLYTHELRLYMNLFQPSVKLLRVERKGSRKIRRYDRPQTPLARLLELAKTDAAIEPSKLEALQRLRLELDPFVLSKIIQLKLSRIYKMARHVPEPKTKSPGPRVEDQIVRAVRGMFKEPSPSPQRSTPHEI